MTLLEQIALDAVVALVVTLARDIFGDVRRARRRARVQRHVLKELQRKRDAGAWSVEYPDGDQ